MPPVHLVYATATCAAADADGIPVHMHVGEPWDATDPFVRARPEFFADTPPAPDYPRRTAPPVELTTAVPGERRGPGRPRRDA